MATLTLYRETIYAQMQAAAAREAQPGESPEQALARWLRTPEGQDQYTAYRNAPAAPATPPPPPLPDVSTACQRSVLKALDAAAECLRRAHPELSPEQAIARAVEVEPQLYADYLAARKADARLARMDLTPRVAPRPAAPAPAPRPLAATPPPPPASSPPPDPRALSHWAWQMICREYPHRPLSAKQALHERFLASVR
jgi:hypothetical protein